MADPYGGGRDNSEFANGVQELQHYENIYAGDGDNVNTARTPQQIGYSNIEEYCKNGVQELQHYENIYAGDGDNVNTARTSQQIGYSNIEEYCKNDVQELQHYENIYAGEAETNTTQSPQPALKKGEIMERQKRSGGMTVVAAAIAAFVLALAGLASALGLSLHNRQTGAESGNNTVARNLLVDASTELMSSLSALRLCKAREAMRELADTALVFAVRAETALECENGEWSECRCKEEFLNDVATILHEVEPTLTAEKAQKMFDYSVKFHAHVTNGADFEYDGELMRDADGPNAPDENAPDENAPAEPSEEEIARDGEMLHKALGAKVLGYLGTYNGRHEYELDRDGVPGYAMTEGGKIYEFSFEHSGNADAEPISESEAAEIAQNCAAACGFEGLKLYSVNIKNDFALVRLCRDIDGAMCRDDWASCAVVGDTAVAFSAVKCDTEHDVPDVKVDEQTARKNAPDAQGEGRLVTRSYGGRDRVCYEYRYELEDGIHYVYVCAETGEQMQVK